MKFLQPLRARFGETPPTVLAHASIQLLARGIPLNEKYVRQIRFPSLLAAPPPPTPHPHKYDLKTNDIPIEMLALCIIRCIIQ